VTGVGHQQFEDLKNEENQMTKIRFATAADIPALVELGKAIHGETRLSRFPFNPKRLAAQFESILSPPRSDYCVFVAEKETFGLVGLFWGQISQYYFSDALVATDFMFYVRPELRGTPLAVRLIHGFRQWATNRGADEVCINMTTGIDIDRFDRFLRHMGFDYTGGNYSQWVVRDGAAK